MKKGYIVGEYIIVAFFFLILFVGVVDRVILITSEELSLAQDFKTCESAERIFKELVDNKDEVGAYGISGGNSIVDYNSTKWLYDNKDLWEYNEDTNRIDQFQLSYEIKGFDVQSAYDSELSGLSTNSPRAQIWLNSTAGDENQTKVHNIIGIAIGGNVAADFEMTLVIPNSTAWISSQTGVETLPTIDNSVTYGSLIKFDWSITPPEKDLVYIGYTTEGVTEFPGWESNWTRYGPGFQTINDIQKNNNLIFIRDISFKNEALGKDYPIYLGNDTLVKATWGAPLTRGCEYKRLYKFEANDSFTITQSVFSEEREVNITRNFIGEVKIISE